MKLSAIRTAGALSILALSATSLWAAEASKFDPKKPAMAPVSTNAAMGKGDAKVKGGDAKNSTAPAVEKRAGPYSCDIHVDNRTRWVIHRVYIDGQNWGSVGVYGDALARDVGAGRTTLYAEADFTDGSTRHWGTVVFNCNAWARHTWHLNP